MAPKRKPQPPPPSSTPMTLPTKTTTTKPTPLLPPPPPPSHTLLPNGSLHPTPPPNLYPTTTPISFPPLAHSHAGFARVFNPQRPTQLDFSDPHAVRQLTYALLARDFQLALDLPADRLCPAVPGRWGYVVWVRGLVGSSGRVGFDGEGGAVVVGGDDEGAGLEGDDNGAGGDGGGDGEEGKGKRQVLGVDIGTGASAIYPLLMLRAAGNYRMVATEIDGENLRWARSNVQRNGEGLGARCVVVEAEKGLVASDGEREEEGEEKQAWLLPVKKLREMGIRNVDFVMTNPPFYASENEMLESARLKKRPPGSSCTGAPVEMIYPARQPATADHAGDSGSGSAGKTTATEEAQQGGEVAFIRRLMRESILLRDAPSGTSADDQSALRIQWFITLLGKKSSLTDHLLPYLVNELRCKNYAVSELHAGTGKTRRWVLGWSWEGWRAGDVWTRGGRDGKVEGLERRWLGGSVEGGFVVEGHVGGRGGVGEKVDECVEELEMDEEEGEEHGYGEERGGMMREGVRWRWRPKENVGVGVCWKGDCWSRKARRARDLERRRREEGGKDGDGDVAMGGDAEADGGSGGTEPKLVFRITVKPGQEDCTCAVGIRWLCGTDAVLFESFCGWLKRKIKEG